MRRHGRGTGRAYPRAAPRPAPCTRRRPAARRVLQQPRPRCV